MGGKESFVNPKHGTCLLGTKMFFLNPEKVRKRVSRIPERNVYL